MTYIFRKVFLHPAKFMLCDDFYILLLYVPDYMSLKCYSSCLQIICDKMPAILPRFIPENSLKVAEGTSVPKTHWSLALLVTGMTLCGPS